MARGDDDKSKTDGEAAADSPSKDSGGPQSKSSKSKSSGRRPPHTIDLKAKEVEDAAQDDTEKDDASADKKDSDAKGAEAKDKAKDAETKDAEASKPADEKADPKAKPKPAPPRTTPGQLRGFVTHLAAGLVGGLVGVVGLGYGVGLPGAGQPVAETTLPPPAAVAPETAAKLTDLEGRLAQIEEARTAQAEVPAAATEQEQRLARVEEAFAAQKGLPAAMKERAIGLEERATALDERLGRIEERWKAQEGFPIAMKERVAKLEDSIKSLGEAAASGGDVAATAAFTSKLNEETGRIDESVDGLRRDIDALVKRLDDAPEPTSNETASEALTARIDDLQKKIAALTERQQVAAAAGEAASAKRRLDALANAIARGLPYSDELAFLAEKLPEDIDTAALQRHAADGAPTRSDLLQRLRDFARGKPVEVTVDESDNSLMGRFLRSAQSVVRVRRTSQPLGEDASAAVARMLELTRQGDLAGAVLTADGLSSEERASLKDWLEAVQSRIDVDAALTALSRRLDRVAAATGAAPGQ